MALGQAPWNLWYLALAGLVLSMALFSIQRGSRAALVVGWGMGTGYFGLALNWLTEPFQVDAAVTAWMAPFALVLMAAGLALFWALAFWGAAQAPRAKLFALVAAWALAELARGYLFTGFPWALVGYLWEPTQAIQWVGWTGSYGLTLVTLALAALLASALRGGWRSGAAGMMLLGGLLWGGAQMLPPLQDLDGRPVVRLVQPNAPQTQKWDRGFVPLFFDRQVEFTAAPAQDGLPRPELIVWPETAVPRLLENAEAELRVITDAALPGRVVLGIQRSEGYDYYNSLALVTQGPKVEAVYDKHHLVPFGEYMPFKELFRHINVSGIAARAEGGYSAGPGAQLVDLGGEIGFALPLICYEAVFPQDLRAAARPDLLLQITNDAWFGNFSGPYQHLAQARIRAIEQGLPLLRAANTGVSAVIDGAGRVLKALPLNEAGFIDAQLPPPLRVTLYSRTGDLPLLALLALLMVLAFVPHRRKTD
ncbi:apolipoprotein N-acyltransferase [Salipiger pacificus]|uniref:Apolipoprotein N-acyltransferase n=2 Tax=Salipiger mangrovisoli TaxID=2865933 RepID=A0ABR9X632_9RHOB|nr:apolipoprotein N-acyltransferase [Salipiger mangrovisoli]MBE9639019.1 apolipoprotein N-acyltransferase [Salipiger mangrovisoli]